ncbi:MAG: response regulator [Flavobacteriales bacterium]|nr:response regulator [Flavobacteriales bacterium]
MKKMILVVDDEQTTCLLLENFLSKDFDVVTKSSGVEALAWLNNHLPDLIITDIQMPGMSGYELLKEVRLIGFHMHTPVVMLSANKESKERIKCYQLGAQDYLTKPFNPEELLEITKKNLFPIHYANVW